VFLGFVPILCAGAGYGLVKLQNRRRRRLKILQEAIQKRSDGRICVDKMIVREWLHANHRRLVKVKFGPEAALHIVDRKGEKLRTFDFSGVNTITMEESQVSRDVKINFYRYIKKIEPYIFCLIYKIEAIIIIKTLFLNYFSEYRFLI